MPALAVQETIEPPKFDTESPAFGAITRFTAADLPLWGKWLVSRLTAHWPTMTAFTAEARVRLWSGSNQHLFIKTADAVALFRLTSGEIDTRPVVEGVFLFMAKDATGQAQKLLRDAARWGRTIKAKEFIAPSVSDLSAENAKIKGLDPRTQLAMDLTK